MFLYITGGADVQKVGDKRGRILWSVNEAEPIGDIRQLNKLVDTLLGLKSTGSEDRPPEHTWKHVLRKTDDDDRPVGEPLDLSLPPAELKLEKMDILWVDHASDYLKTHENAKAPTPPDAKATPAEKSAPPNPTGGKGNKKTAPPNPTGPKTVAIGELPAKAAPPNPTGSKLGDKPPPPNPTGYKPSFASSVSPSPADPSLSPPARPMVSAPKAAPSPQPKCQDSMPFPVATQTATSPQDLVSYQSAMPELPAAAANPEMGQLVHRLSQYEREIESLRYKVYAEDDTWRRRREMEVESSSVLRLRQENEHFLERERLQRMEDHIKRRENELELQERHLRWREETLEDQKKQATLLQFSPAPASRYSARASSVSRPRADAIPQAVVTSIAALQTQNRELAEALYALKEEIRSSKSQPQVYSIPPPPRGGTPDAGGRGLAAVADFDAGGDLSPRVRVTLRAAGLRRHEQAFAVNKMDEAALLNASAADLHELGLDDAEVAQLRDVINPQPLLVHDPFSAARLSQAQQAQLQSHHQHQHHQQQHQHQHQHQHHQHQHQHQHHQQHQQQHQHQQQQQQQQSQVRSRASEGYPALPVTTARVQRPVAVPPHHGQAARVPLSAQDEAFHRSVLNPFYSRHDPSKQSHVDYLIKDLQGEITSIYPILEDTYHVETSPYASRIAEALGPARSAAAPVLADLWRGREGELLEHVTKQAPDWREMVSSAGRPFYFSATFDISQWCKPLSAVVRDRSAPASPAAHPAATLAQGLQRTPSTSPQRQVGSTTQYYRAWVIAYLLKNAPGRIVEVDDLFQEYTGPEIVEMLTQQYEG